jgi:hypothetical protein
MDSEGGHLPSIRSKKKKRLKLKKGSIPNNKKQ